MDRRTFLRASAIGLPALTLAACRRGAPAQPVLPEPFDKLGVPLAKGARPGLQVFAGAGELLEGRDQRMPVGLTNVDGTTIADARARAWTAATDGTRVEGPFDIAWQRYARSSHGDPTGFYLGVVTIPTTGRFVTMLVEATVGGAVTYGSTVFEPKQETVVAKPGDRAKATPTPTVDEPRGMETICTRKPACPMHEVSLDAALERGKPVLFTVGSPAFCTSRTCGPVLEEILLARERFDEQVTFIHAEPYEEDSPGSPGPVVEQWNLPSEPWVFVIDGRGFVRGRFEGPVTLAELEPALAAVVAEG